MSGTFITKELLTDAFTIWNKMVQEKPADFDFNAVWADPSDSAQVSAEFLLHIITNHMRMEISE